ncbi:MAG: tail tape measure protein, partial [Allosphingosinicella sp.]
GGLLAAAAQILGGLLGAPGRATGGPVAPGRPYMVGERGPELFVPTASGRIEAGRGGARDIRMSIIVNAAAGEAPQALARSSRQVARAVKQALMRVED